VLQSSRSGAKPHDSIYEISCLMRLDSALWHQAARTKSGIWVNRLNRPPEVTHGLLAFCRPDYIISRYMASHSGTDGDRYGLDDLHCSREWL